MKKLFLFVVLGCVCFVAQAQTKVGYANVDYIFEQMPDSKQIEAELKTLQTQLKNNLDGKIAKFQKDLAEYNNAGNTVPDAVRANTERELRQQQENIQKLQQEAEANVQNKHAQLMEPVYKKMGDAIQATAKENGFNLVLSEQIGGLDVVLHADESIDISDLVLKKLGITPKPAAANNAPATTTPAPTTPKPGTK
jgi:outer membrane protein